MTPLALKAELVRRGVRMADIARELGVTVGAVSQAVSGYSKSRRIRAAIASRIALPVSEIWPDATQQKFSTRGRRAATTTR